MSTSLVCAVHPHRAGVALCVECRRTVCEECTTRVRGINRCSECLSRQRHAEGARGRTAGWVDLAPAALAYAGIASLCYAVASWLAP